MALREFGEGGMYANRLADVRGVVINALFALRLSLSVPSNHNLKGLGQKILPM